MEVFIPITIFGAMSPFIIASCSKCVDNFKDEMEHVVKSSFEQALDGTKNLHQQQEVMSQNPVVINHFDNPQEAKMEKVLKEVAGESPVRYTSYQIRSLTNNYSQLLGSGGFGKVYLGQFSNGLKAAVKLLNPSHNEQQAEEQFLSEVTTIGRTYHVNLVKLYGFCYDKAVKALVYEYMENGSLDNHLFRDTNGRVGWDELYAIAVGTAKGLRYLHEECQRRIIHYDIKPGNILLDANFEPKIADFGLAKLLNREDTHISLSGYRGTPGYSAPEIFNLNYPVTYKCDVYSFGMLLFEILGRRKNVITTSSSDSVIWFPKHVWDKYENGEMDTLTVECRIEERNRQNAERAAMIALWCVQDSPDLRPPMSNVVRMFESGVEIMPPPKPSHYLFSSRRNLPINLSGQTSDGSSSQGSFSGWYKETRTPTMASSSSSW